MHKTLLALITIATVPLIFLITWIIGKVTRENFRKRQRQLGEINGDVEEVITGIKEVRLFRREGSFLDSLEEKNRILKAVSLKAQIFAGFMGPSMNMLNNLLYGIIVAVGGILHVNGSIRSWYHRGLPQLYPAVWKALKPDRPHVQLHPIRPGRS